jgi:hypothetical protein
MNWCCRLLLNPLGPMLGFLPHVVGNWRASFVSLGPDYVKQRFLSRADGAQNGVAL